MSNKMETMSDKLATPVLPAQPGAAPAPRLLDRVVARLRTKHYSLRTEQA
jgi:hypothetical protein